MLKFRPKNTKKVQYTHALTIKNHRRNFLDTSTKIRQSKYTHM